jgi:hypothetical protein
MLWKNSRKISENKTKTKTTKTERETEKCLAEQLCWLFLLVYLESQYFLEQKTSDTETDTETIKTERETGTERETESKTNKYKRRTF